MFLNFSYSFEFFALFQKHVFLFCFFFFCFFFFSVLSFSLSVLICSFVFFFSFVYFSFFFSSCFFLFIFPFLFFPFFFFFEGGWKHARRIDPKSRGHGASRTPHEAGLGPSGFVPLPVGSNRDPEGRHHHISGFLGKVLKRHASDRSDLPIDYRFLRPRSRSGKLRLRRQNRSGRSGDCFPSQILKIISKTMPAQRVHGGTTTPRSMNQQTKLQKSWKISRPCGDRSSNSQKWSQRDSSRTELSRHWAHKEWRRQEELCQRESCSKGHMESA